MVPHKSEWLSQHSEQFRYITQSEQVTRGQLVNKHRLVFCRVVWPVRAQNLVDNMIGMMEKYADHLEELVNERTQQLEDEKKKTDQLLHQMLPR